MRLELQGKRQENKDLNNEFIGEEMYVNKLREETKRISKMLADEAVFNFF